MRGMSGDWFWSLDGKIKVDAPAPKDREDQYAVLKKYAPLIKESLTRAWQKEREDWAAALFNASIDRDKC